MGYQSCIIIMKFLVVASALVAGICAEADPALLYAGYAGYPYALGYGVGLKSAPCVNAANVPVPCAAGYGLVHHYGKRKLRLMLIPLSCTVLMLLLFLSAPALVLTPSPCSPLCWLCWLPLCCCLWSFPPRRRCHHRRSRALFPRWSVHQLPWSCCSLLDNTNNITAQMLPKISEIKIRNS